MAGYRRAGPVSTSETSPAKARRIFIPVGDFAGKQRSTSVEAG